MNDYIIETKALTFAYNKKSRNILNNIFLQVPRASIYGFLGANGAGKSTTMQLLTGIIEADSNESIFLFNKPLEQQLPEVFNKIGCLIDSPSLYTHISGYDNLKYIAKMKNVDNSQIERVLQLVELSYSKHQKVKQYSLGMKQRLAIAFALLGNPELLFLDEPINGLDPQGIIDIRNLLIKLNREHGITIFISSHLLDEVEKICTHIGILNKGELIFDGTIDELKAKSESNKQVFLTINNADYWYKQLQENYQDLTIKDHTISFKAQNKEEINKIMIELLSNNAEITEMKTSKGLEDLFLNLSKINN